MKLVIDINILISALLKDSVTRDILLFPEMEFYLPEYALDEIETHKNQIIQRSSLSENEIDIILATILENIQIIPSSQIKPFLNKVQDIMGAIDPCDVPFLALAFAVENEGLWSNDKHFRSIQEIKIWTTHDLFKRIGNKQQ
ncbi:MAG: PIN domain-containing protein [Pseudomonadota bacterium]